MAGLSPVFLAGPPGAGKSSLGEAASIALELRFLDLGQGTTNMIEQVARLEAAIVALPWSVIGERSLLTEVRRAGVLVGLWAHPVDMAARSGRDVSSFTTGSLAHRGFGRKGTSCLQFRALERACHETLLLVGLGFEDASVAVREAIAGHRAAHDAPPAERAGIAWWVDHFCQDAGASQEAAVVVVDAMGRYLMQLAADGASARKLRGLHSDLEAGALLVLGYDAPTAGDALSCFASVPHLYTFERKFTSSPNLVARYEHTMRGFADFLRATHRNRSR